jgi:hypothetical protein
MELPNELKKKILETELKQLKVDEYLIKTRLAIALEVKNMTRVPELEDIVEKIVLSINAIEQRIKELEA